MKRRLALVICLVITSLLLSGHAFAQKRKDYVQGVTKDEILIAAFVPMTGSVAYAGIAQTEATQLYFNEVNAKGGVYGRKLKLLIEDDGCTPIKGVAAVNKLLSEKVFMLYGPSCSGVAAAVLETVVKEGIPWFSMSASTPKTFVPLRKNVFRMGSFPDNLQAKAVVDFDIHNLKARRMAIMYDSSDYGKVGADGIAERLAEYGLKPVATEAYNMGDTDFTAQVLKVREAKPEVVHLYGYPKESAIVIRQAKELGLNAQFFGCTSLTAAPFLEAAGDSSIGMISVYAYPYMIDSPEPHIVDFVKRLKENYRLTPGRPSYVEMGAYGSAMVVVEGLRRAGKNLTWEKYISALETIKDFKTGFDFPVTFSLTDHNGQKEGGVVVAVPGKRWSLLADPLVIREKVEKVE